MKLNLKSISLVLVLVISIGLLAGCTREEPQKDETVIEDLTLATGFIQSKSEEDGKSFIEFSVEGEDLKLEVVDESLFDSLEEDEFYIFSYNKDSLLRNVQRDIYLRDLVKNSMDKEDEDEHFLQEITSEDAISLDGLTLLDEYIFDFNSDGYEEIIAMYVAAERDDKGEIMWDDGQRWVLVAHGDNKDYVLYDDYVQLGSVQFNVFTDDDEFYIVTKSVRTASLTICEYKYDKAKDVFIQSMPYDVDGNVNMLHSSK
ncbi:MAG: hypothetical protein RIN55_09630 [Tissierellaceae bacterium]|nr:hypothetical protein [Tissierellaceae bacterium]